MPRPKRTAEEKWLSGDYRADRDRSKPQESQVAASRPKMPKHLSPMAQEYWKRVVRLLAERRVLTAADGPALEVLAEQYARWRACLADVDTNGVMVKQLMLDGSERRVQNPAAKLAAQLEVSMRMMLKELSATPFARDKVKPAAPDPKDQGPEPGTVAWFKAHGMLNQKPPAEPATEPPKIEPPQRGDDISDDEIGFEVN